MEEVVASVFDLMGKTTEPQLEEQDSSFGKRDKTRLKIPIYTREPIFFFF